MTKLQKTAQLTKKGEGYATAILCPTLKTPFIIIAATPDDLMSLLVIRCGLDPEMITDDKFRRVKIEYAIP